MQSVCEAVPCASVVLRGHPTSQRAQLLGHYHVAAHGRGVKDAWRCQDVVRGGGECGSRALGQVECALGPGGGQPPCCQHPLPLASFATLPPLLASPASGFEALTLLFIPFPMPLAPLQDEALKKAVKKYTADWPSIGASLGRSDVEAEARWRKIEKKYTNKGPWTPEVCRGAQWLTA